MRIARLFRCERGDGNPVATDRRSPHPRVPRLGREEVVDPDAQVPCHRQQQLERRLALAGFEARERAGRHAGPRRDVVERESPRTADGAEPRPDLFEFVSEADQLNE